MRVVCGESDKFAKWAGNQLNTEFVPPYEVIGVVSSNVSRETEPKITGAIVCNGYTGSDIELTFVGKGALKRGVCRAVAHYVFVQLGCRRTSISIRASDVNTRKLAIRFGFTFEGIKREFFDGEDAILFGMIKSECRWLRLRDESTQATRSPRPQRDRWGPDGNQHRNGDSPG